MTNLLAPLKERLAADPVFSRLARGIGWSAIGVVCSRLAVLVCGVMAARFLSRDGFGSLGIIQSTVAMFQVVASLGLGAAATKFLAESRLTDPERAGRRLGLCFASAVAFGAVSSLLLALLSGPLAASTMRRPELQPFLALSAPTLFLSAVAGVVLGALAGLERFRAAATAQVAGGAAGIIVTLLAVPRFGLHGAIAALIVMALIQGAVGLVLLSSVLRENGITLSIRSALSERSAVLGFSLPATAASLVSTPALWCSHALLVRSPGGVNEMATLSAANQWFAALSFLPLVIAQPLVSVMAERLSAGDPGSVRRILRLSVRSSIALVLPVVAALVACGRWVMGFYGAEYRNGWPVLALLSIAALLFIVQSPVGQLVTAAGRMWIGLAMNLAWGVTVVALSALLLRHGAAGLATARAAAYLAHVGWSWLAASAILNRNITRSDTAS